MPKIATWQIILYLVIFIIAFTMIAVGFWLSRLGKEDKRKFKKIEKPKEEAPKA